MPATVKEVQEYLIELAKQRHEPITYRALARHFGMTIRDEGDVRFWGNLLGEISESEVQKGNPMLSALVITEEMNRPGNGFYDLARNLGRYRGASELDHLAFAATELQSIYDTWAGDDSL